MSMQCKQKKMYIKCMLRHTTKNKVGPLIIIMHSKKIEVRAKKENYYLFLLATLLNLRNKLNQI